MAGRKRGRVQGVGVRRIMGEHMMLAKIRPSWRLMLAKIRPSWHYTGLPVIAAALFAMNIGTADPFMLLKSTLLLAFGYVAAILDLKTKRIPNGLVLLMLAAWVLLMALKLLLKRARRSGSYGILCWAS